MPPYSPQFLPVEVGLARLRVHRTRNVSDTHVHCENRGVGGFDFHLTLDGEVQEVFAVPPEQLGLTNFKVISDFTMRLDGDPDPSTPEPDWDTNPISCNFRVLMCDSDEVFSDGKRIFPFGLDYFVEPFCLLAVRRVEFNAGIALQEPLESFVFVVEDLTFNIGQSYNLCLDDFADFHQTTSIIKTIIKTTV